MQKITQFINGIIMIHFIYVSFHNLQTNMIAVELFKKNKNALRLIVTVY